MNLTNAAAALGRLGGAAKSKAKSAAAKANGKLGGWPKGKKRGPRKNYKTPAAMAADDDGLPRVGR